MNKESFKKVLIEALQEIGQNQQTAPTAVLAQNSPPAAPQAVAKTIPSAEPKQKLKATLVKFDQNTNDPFEVKFSKRGFVVEDTRLSFEILEQALSKEFNIVLNAGSGLVLTPVRMQKIMKYKDLY